ncbi:tripartite tricarboxylate transporter TctB family protein [Streptomyces zingiberis]|uniref:Tripartite tricarboxylate transporter TctB family protein n=1 Tax=Streptomyces zingiberis TaxID=2053010 RepID=A0ABX1BXZ4_9ACTN|nr:tripartite tricarboxylate transporter TctB family protein [Streptomyces zingiberis]NJQ00730.1 tripartite tricarboxylate transporter TctB family protein [Streptomyces zingiberis]
MRHFRYPQRAVAAALGVLALGYTLMAFGIPDFQAVEVPVQPGTLPRVLGLLLLALAVALFFQSAGEEEPEAESPAPALAAAKTPPGPAAQDSSAQAASAGDGAGAAGAAGAAAGASAAGGAASAAPERPTTMGRLADDRLELLALLGAMCLYVALFVPLGFVLSTALYVAGTAWYLGSRRHWVNVLVGAGLALGLYLGMSQGLDVALPTGPLPF